MLMLHDYSSLVFFIVLCSTTPLLGLINVVRNRTYKVLEHENYEVEVWIKPTIFYILIIFHAIPGIFISLLILSSPIYPNITKLICHYNIVPVYQANYSCKYLERNPLGLQTSVKFSKIEKAELYESDPDDFQSLFNLVLSISDIDRQNILLKKIEQLKTILRKLNIKLDINLNIERQEITFPLKIESNQYDFWSEEKRKIYNFINYKTNKDLIVIQDINPEAKNGYYFVDLAFKILLLFSFPIIILYAIAPTTRCILDVNNNSFYLQRQRFFGIVMYQKILKLNEIKAVLSVETKVADSFGSRLVLALKSGEQILITYTFDNIDSQSKLKICNLFNRLLGSIK